MNKPIYLDYAATTPVAVEVAEAMRSCLLNQFGNPSSTTHHYGWEASELVEQSRAQVAESINAEPKSIIFVSGATEANNLALQGVANAHSKRGRHIITSQTEHKSILDVCAFLESQDFMVTYLKPEANGLIKLEDFIAAIRPDTILASMMLVNNETGVIADIAKFSEIARQHNILFHTDAAQAMGKILVNVKELGVDLLSLSAHKAYGPKGIGALYVNRKPRVNLQALIYGGGQEQGLRAGTLPSHQILGMARALQLVSNDLASESTRIAKLKERLWQGISTLPHVFQNGGSASTVANILNISFAHVDGEALLMALQDIAVSSGSACTSASILPSHVLKAMGISDTLAHSTIRFSLGRYTTPADIAKTIELVSYHVNKLRSLSPLWNG